MQHNNQERRPEAFARPPWLGAAPGGNAPPVAERPRLLVVDSRPLVRRLVIDIAFDLRLPAAEAEGAAEALQLLDNARGDDGRITAAPLVLVVAVGAGRGPDAPAALAVEAARRRPDLPPPGVVYVGARPGALGDRPLGGNERFLVEPFGLRALARAAHEALGWPVPRWLAHGTRPPQPWR